PDVLGLFLLERVQRGTDRLDETAESRFQIVERADATVGIDQQIAQRLVVLAYARTDLGQGRFASLFGTARAGFGGGRHRIRCGGGSNAFTPKKIGDRTHGMPHNLTQPRVYTDFSGGSQLATAKVTILRKIKDLVDDSEVTHPHRRRPERRSQA